MKTHVEQQTSLTTSFVRKSQSGFSLIEIMVAALVLAVGVLGVVSLQVLGLKGTHQSFMKTQAMSIVRDVTEKMHANKLGVIRGEYLADSTNFVCFTTIETCNKADSNCTYEEIATLDLNNIICGHKIGTAPRVNGVKAVNAGDKPQLIDGELQITCPNGCDSGELLINLSWQERNLHKSEGNSLPKKDSLIVSTRIIQ